MTFPERNAPVKKSTEGSGGLVVAAQYQKRRSRSFKCSYLFPVLAGEMVFKVSLRLVFGKDDGNTARQPVAQIDRTARFQRTARRQGPFPQIIYRLSIERFRCIKAAIYCRVSTKAGQSVEMQLRDLRQLAEQRGFEIVGEYCDEGVSGSCDSRPQLDRMLSDSQRGKFQAILIWRLDRLDRLDRLGRSLQHLVRLFENFRAWNVALISFGEGLDFSTSMGKLFYQLSGAFAEFERDCIRERVKAGMRNARAKGRHIGRPRVIVDAARIGQLSALGTPWAKIG